MKYALNTQKGSTINHPSVGRLEGGIAKLVSDQDANQLKHILNVVIFDSIEKGE